ncbi:MAG: class I SAM-dependent methyltransferase [Bacteroidetes Order II. Incertae sedis bacterium]|nr:class I SAM-dependent methyltransferase [Bacteroidetes Order II. bacterium]
MSFIYDEIPYTNQTYPEMAPAQMAVMGRLFGLETFDMAHSRVLEVGCGNGMNLIPLAMAAPESTFEGLDLSETAILEGQKMVEALGIRNLTLFHADVTQWPLKGPSYDFIMAHGVYSWVPPTVRESLLRLYKNRLATTGLGYISFKTYPGAHFYAASRNMMRYHTHDLADPQTQIEQSMALLRFVLSGQPENPTVLHHRFYKDYLQAEWDRLSALPDWYLQHDHLADFSEPFYFHQVHEALAMHGLQYWSDAHFPAMQIRNFPKPVQQVLVQMPVLVREQYLDFLLGRAFRQALVCHAEIPRSVTSQPESLLSCVVGAPFQIQETPPTGFVLTGHNGSTIVSDNGAVRVIAAFLGAKWPQMVPVQALITALKNTLSVHPDQQPLLVTRILLGLYADGLLVVRTIAPNVSQKVPQRPLALKAARFQAAYGLPFLTNGLHEAKPISDPAIQCLIPLLDGTRDADVLLSDWQKALSKGYHTMEITKETLESVLQTLWLDTFLEDYVEETA